MARQRLPATPQLSTAVTLQTAKSFHQGTSRATMGVMVSYGLLWLALLGSLGLLVVSVSPTKSQTFRAFEGSPGWCGLPDLPAFSGASFG